MSLSEPVRSPTRFRVLALSPSVDEADVPCLGFSGLIADSFLRTVVVLFKQVFNSRNQSLSAFPSQPHNRDFLSLLRGVAEGREKV